MSQRREQSEDFELGDAVTDIAKWYHIPTLVALLGFMFLIRVQSYQNFLRNGKVLLRGNDAWYHLRQTSYVVRNWPQTMPFDPWTYFPYGTASSQFGTLYDQIVATIALIVGLGSPDQQTIAMVMLIAPAIFGTAAAIPVYIAGRRVGGRFGGIVAVLVLALSTGGFLGRSVAGFPDHHVAEALFQIIGVLGIMVAVSVAESERPVWELVVNREWDALRKPLGWSILAGFGIALYIWVWPPGVLLIGILGIFFLLQLNADYLRGTSPDHVAFVGVVSLVTAGLLLFLPFNTSDITALDFSILQPMLAFSVAAGCAFMAWLARQWDNHDISRLGYPGAIVGIIALVTILMAVLTPDLLSYFDRNIRRLFVAGGARAGTVGEAQPLRRPVDTLIRNYKLMLITALLGLLAIVFEQVRSKRASAQTLLVLVWAVVLVLATLSQRRFEYYLVLPIAVLSAHFIGLIVKYTMAGATGEHIEDIKAYQIIIFAAVLVVLIVPAFTLGTPVTDVGNRNAPSPGVVGWDSSLEWLQENTPAEGTYGGANNSMDYYGTYKQQDDFDYPDGSYGVISWWDYGHWITTRGERIPTANPFQQGAETAANFLLAPNETRANEVIQSVSEDDAKTRYVMVDWKMTNVWGQARGKFFAPTVFYSDSDVGTGDFYRRALIQQRGQGRQVRALTSYYIRTQRYYDSMVNRLWHFHGSAQPPASFAVDYNGGATGRWRAAQQPLQRFRSPEEARQFVEEDGSAQVGGVGPNPPEFVSALEHYRLVRNSNTSAVGNRSAYVQARQREAIGLAGDSLRNSSRIQQIQTIRSIQQQFLLPQAGQPPWVKIFERVPGATIEGQGPPNTNITAAVEMRSATTGSSFAYRQMAKTGPDGNFELTVPYSTTGYENFGPKNGYTDVSVRATGKYQIYESASSTNFQPRTRTNTTSGNRYAFISNASVPEAKVIGEDTEPIQVDLGRRVISEGNTTAPGSQNETQSPGSQNKSQVTSGNETTDTGTGNTAGTNTTNGSTDQTTNRSTGGATNESSTNTSEQPNVAIPARITDVD